MIKNDLVVPKGIRYLSDWKDFNFNLFPKKCILDKVIPGCGFTQYCLTGKENVILCSPRKILLENKKDKHKDDVYLVKNEFEVTLNYDKHITDKPDKSAINAIIKNPTKEEVKKIYTRLEKEIESYKISRDNLGFKPYKILVTYDSFHIVKDILDHLDIFKSFVVVVDEFQTVLHDAKFKSNTELKFLESLQDSHSSVFVSATPMMDQYLEEIDEFKDLSYYKFDWITEDSERAINPNIRALTMKSVNTKCKEIIDKYLVGKFDKVNRVDKETGEIIEVVSNEAVFYVNSVNHIINVINKCKLQPDQVNILCSDTDYNRRRMKQRLNIKGHSIGKVPLEGQPNKMFTFCTRTVYLGADFYSKCARTFIFSDANINTLVVDISEDLAQILGRQRDNDNPWAKSAMFYYTPSSKNNQEEYKKNREIKLESSRKLLRAFEEVSEENKDALAKTYEFVAKTANYRDNYVAVNSGGNPVLNKLVVLAEQRAYEIQKYDYADRVTIFNKLNDTFGEDSIEQDNELAELHEKYSKLTTFPDKLKLLCSVSADLMYRFINMYLSDSDEIKSILLILSQKKISAFRYNITDIRKEVNKEIKLKEIKFAIYEQFKEGDHFSNVGLAEKLQKIYDTFDIDLKAKATDIKKWFDVQALKLQNKKEDKRVNGLKLLKKIT